MKDLAIIIRTHGTVPVDFQYNSSVDRILANTVFNYNGLVDNIYSITIAKTGGVCYGSPDIKKYVDEINELKQTLSDTENIHNTEELVHYLYGPNPKIKPIHELNNEIFGISFLPIITEPKHQFSLNKMYSGDNIMKNLGIYYLSSDGLTETEINEIKNIFQTITTHINNGPTHYVTKLDILNELSKFHISRLFFIDFTCYAFKNKNNQPLNEDAVNWLNQVINSDNLKGGSKKSLSKRRRRRKQKTRRIRKKRTNIRK